MVEGVTPRKLATSLVVHQSVGSGSATRLRLQRLRCLVAAGALWPDDGDRYAALPRFGHHISGAAISASGLAIPDGEQPVGVCQHDAAGLHMSLLGRFGAVEAVYLGGLGQQRVVGGVGGLGQPVAVLGSRDDDFELAACVEDGLGEELVCPVRQVAIPTRSLPAQAASCWRIAVSMSRSVVAGSPRWPVIAMRIRWSGSCRHCAAAHRGRL